MSKRIVVVKFHFLSFREDIHHSIPKKHTSNALHSPAGEYAGDSRSVRMRHHYVTSSFSIINDISVADVAPHTRVAACSVHTQHMHRQSQMQHAHTPTYNGREKNAKS